MQIITDPQLFQAACLKLKQEGFTLALVPTMGALHDGHKSLMVEGRDLADKLLVSVFVNPTQFGPNEDFDSYPRTFNEDCEKLAAAGVDVLFAPSEQELYPEPQQYLVVPAGIEDLLEGEFRPGHFRGVATVVLKLFNIFQPHVAVFGTKDYQQLMVLSNMVREMSMPIEVVPGETVRAEAPATTIVATNVTTLPSSIPIPWIPE